MTDSHDSGADLTAARNSMVDRLESRIDHSSTDRAMRAVPRHEFVPEARRDSAYEDRPLPIGSGQTISAPHMVAIMTDHLALEPGDRVLEIGTGCGYHAAVTAEVVDPENVFSVEYHSELASWARETLESLGYGDIFIRTGDGHEGWPEHGPYDAAYLTCAAASFPDAVVEQVRDGGTLVAPIGTNRQRLIVADKQAGELIEESHGPVRFVQMQGRG